MHLKFEVKYLIITILLPMIFLMFALGVFLARRKFMASSEELVRSNNFSRRFLF